MYPFTKTYFSVFFLFSNNFGSLIFFLIFLKSIISAGVIDEDYRGNVGVVLFNHSDVEFKIAKGDRIAQLICEKIYYPELVEVKVCIE